MPRFFRKDTGDKAFIEFRKNRDPLQSRYFSVNWVNALFEWNRRLEKSLKLDRTIYILQGTEDKTVEWKYNLPFLEKRISNTEITLYKKGNHQLLNEEESLRSKVFERINNILKKGQSTGSPVLYNFFHKVPEVDTGSQPDREVCATIHSHLLPLYITIKPSVYSVDIIQS